MYAIDLAVAKTSLAGCGSQPAWGCTCFLRCSGSALELFLLLLFLSVLPVLLKSSLYISLATPSLVLSLRYGLIILFYESLLVSNNCGFSLLIGPRGITQQEEGAFLPGSMVFSSWTYTLAPLGKLPHQQHMAKHILSRMFRWWPR